MHEEHASSSSSTVLRKAKRACRGLASVTSMRVTSTHALHAPCGCSVGAGAAVLVVVVVVDVDWLASVTCVPLKQYCAKSAPSSVMPTQPHTQSSFTQHAVPERWHTPVPCARSRSQCS